MSGATASLRGDLSVVLREKADIYVDYIMEDGEKPKSKPVKSSDKRKPWVWFNTLSAPI